MTNWKKYKLGDDYIKIIDGDRGVNYPKYAEYFNNEHCLFLNAGNVTDSGFNFSKCQFITSEKDSILGKGKLVKNDIVLTTRGTVGNVAYFNDKIDYQNIRINSGMVIFRCDNSNISSDYLYQILNSKLFKNKIKEFKSGTAQPQLPIKDLERIELTFPPLPEQKAIASVLSSLDDKIELNRRQNETLEKIAQAIFKHWFVDFNFPDEKGKPYKDSGGEMIESELGLIPKGWRVGKLGEVINIFDSIRIPLSSRERELRKGKFRYFGASSIVDYVDDYLFDGIYLLMGEDGTVIDENGFPILQYVWGQFWVNNHAHVLQGKGNISTEFLYILLKQTNILTLVTGAVQPKINQNNLNNLKIIIPELEILNKYNSFIENIFSKLRLLYEENQTLSQIRDELLPKLMSGKLRVKGVENE